jgi:phosphoglucomutase
MDAAIQQRVQAWLNGNYDEATKSEIKKLSEDDPGALADAFYRNLEFGTGGLRGIMGVGTNRINKYTIGMCTQGYAKPLRLPLRTTAGTTAGSLLRSRPV